ncbi:ATP-binding protein [Nocardia sp. NPDC056100]|uniref:ATP-binding protein n=1 Tax=Nocardia sp. NPDC056100 TaxID=3345712 RepID=UPI0035D6D6E5
MTGLPRTHHGSTNGKPHRTGGSHLRLVSPDEAGTTRHPMDDAHGHTIGVRVPAEASQLIMLRALAETVCLTADFDVSMVTDIRVALDEVATALVSHRTPGTEISCDFTYDEQSIEVRINSVSQTDAAFRVASMGWHLLQAITDDLQTEVGPFDHHASGYPTQVRFTRNRDWLPLD